MDPSELSALVAIAASVALVIVTALYVWLTRRMVVHMQSSHVSPDIRLVGLGSGAMPLLRVTNSGPAAAVNIEGNYCVEGLSDEHHFFIRLLRPGEEKSYFIELGDERPRIRSLAGDNRVLAVELRWTQATGVSRGSHQIAFSDVWKGAKHQLYEETFDASFVKKTVDNAIRRLHEELEILNRQLGYFHDVREGKDEEARRLKESLEKRRQEG